jgi:hypothetical protein
MDGFEELLSSLSQQELALLCQLNGVVGREMLITCNIYRLLKEGLVKVGEPLVGSADGHSTYLHSYKLTRRGAEFLNRLRSESSRRANVGA